MRTLVLIALAGLAAGCDVVREGSFSEKPGYMKRLDGTWSLQVSTRTISTSGAVTEAADPVVKQVEFARSMQCLSTQIDAAGDDDRVMYLDGPPFRPGTAGADRCYIITVDETVDRFIFVGERSGGLDLAYNILENTDDRQVLASYSGQRTDGSVVETRWTLTR